MTDERAIEILDPEHREHYESIEPVNEACRIGMEAIRKVKELKTENAALRERLEKAVELPVKVGDIVYCVEDEDGDYIVEPTVVTKKNIYLLCSRIKGNPSDAFLLQKAAEEWCKELKGEKE